MSSAVYLKLNQPIPRDAWLAFCAEHGILYSPRTIGRNTFYANGREVDVGGMLMVVSETQTEIKFGKPNYTATPLGQDGKIDVAQVQPPEEAQEITVSTIYGGPHLQAVADTALFILATWPGSWDCDVELRSLMELQEAERPRDSEKEGR